MSDVFYPLSLIARQQVTRFNPVTADQFEDGTTATRLRWTASYFKRRFEIQHAPLTLAEWKYLRSFYAQRSGGYDSFWFRDNPGRGGNAKVRFASPLPENVNAAALASLTVTLEEVAPIRALPEFDELTTAAGTAPVVWFDANRELYWSHAGTSYYDGTGTTHDASGNGRSLTWSATSQLSNVLAQYQYAGGNGTGYATRASDGTQAGNLTLFVIARASSSASRQVLFQFGGTGTKESIGLQINASNEFEGVFDTASPSWTYQKYTNSAADTWRSFAVQAPTPPLGNGYLLYVNGTVANATADTLGGLNTVSKKITLLSGISNGNICASGTDVMHAILFNATLSQAQIRAVHNLIGYQAGLATV